MDARYLCADALEQLGYQGESGPWRSAYPVSYTHLFPANFKRNMCTSYLTSPGISWFWEDFPGLYETLDELKGLHPEFISCTYGAVSYTHLDVYKRQPFML